jgi:hypothetical protein
MVRFARPAFAALLLASSALPALAQTAAPAVTPYTTMAPIPAVVDRPWPGVVKLDVDATDLNRRIFNVHETIPVEGAGPLTLFFPAWLPGDHGPDGPITQLAGLVFTANGQRLEWTRDPVESFAFHLVVPEGVTEISADFQHLSPTAGAQGRVTMTAEMLNAQWEKMLLYPAGPLAPQHHDPDQCESCRPAGASARRWRRLRQQATSPPSSR